MRTVNYKVRFEYSLDDLTTGKNETGMLSETVMNKESVVRMLIMISPFTYMDNLKNLLALQRKNEFMVVNLADSNKTHSCRRIVKIIR